MHFTTFLASVVFALGATAAPVEPAAYDRVALFDGWTTLCGSVETGHGTGSHLIERAHAGLCFPLPDEIRGLNIVELSAGCRVLAYNSPVCDDYPYHGAWMDRTACLFTGGSRYRSYKVECDAKE
ncbi:hypothetical protein QBC44DRAFT_380169 [Cladorrhinum sp. PSN332]|nr:hypothetical protein QBC44DRAFT_380169 [Cladorrhinum sp. PSN332]